MNVLHAIPDHGVECVRYAHRNARPLTPSVRWQLPRQPVLPNWQAIEEDLHDPAVGCNQKGIEVLA